MSITFYSPVEDSREVVVPDGRIRILLETLGLDDIDDERVGTCLPNDFLGRVLIALALIPSGPMRGGAPFTLAGRTPELLHDVLSELRELADQAVSRNILVLWA